MTDEMTTFVDPGAGQERALPTDDVWFALLARKLTMLSGYMVAITPRTLRFGA